MFMWIIQLDAHLQVVLLCWPLSKTIKFKANEFWWIQLIFISLVQVLQLEANSIIYQSHLVYDVLLQIILLFQLQKVTKTTNINFLVLQREFHKYIYNLSFGMFQKY